MDKHIHWKVLAYANHDVMSGNYHGGVTLDLVAETRTEAIERAAVLIPRSTFDSPDKAGYVVLSLNEVLGLECRG